MAFLLWGPFGFLRQCPPCFRYLIDAPPNRHQKRRKGDDPGDLNDYSVQAIPVRRSGQAEETRGEFKYGDEREV